MDLLHRQFERRARAGPDRRAVVAGSRSLTYGEVDRRADHLADRLRVLALGPGETVAIAVGRRLELPVAMLAALKAGVTQVPIDPTHPPERIRQILELSRAGAMLAVAEHAALASPRLDPARVLLVDDDEAVRGEPARNGAAAIDPEAAAFLLFTSGTTGRPKGVLISHRAVANTVPGLAAAFGLTADDVYLNTGSSTFVMSLRQLLSPLCVGGGVALVSREHLADPRRLFEAIRDAGATAMDFIPTFWATCVRVLERLPAAERTELLTNRLRLIMSGGEPLPRSLVGDWVALGHPARLVNTLGLSETAGTIFCHPIDPEVDGDGPGNVPIGQPLPHVRLHLVDDDLRPVADGEIGELCYGGPCLATRYLDDPELTARHFVPSPIDGSLLYRSGDRARVTPAGLHEFVGRTDLQIKVRGFRVDPGEVESVLREHAGVREAAVVPAADPIAGHRLIAYVVPARDGGSALERAVRDHALARLPDYLVPSAVLAIDALPLTASNKLDRRALAARPLPPAAASDAPTEPLPRLLARIGAELIGIDHMGADDDLFALGGHSLTIIRLLAEVRSLFEVEVPIAELFRRPTIAALAEVIVASVGRQPADERASELLARGAAPPPAIERVDRSDGARLPLSFEQQRMWFLHQLDPDGAAYHIRRVWRLGGAVDPAAVQRALEAVIARHEALRTVFPAQDGVPWQRVCEPQPLPLPVDDLGSLAPATREQELVRRARAETVIPFDLAAGPLVRARLLRLAPDDHALVLTVHHIVADAWSLEVLWRELVSFHDRDGSDLQPLPVHYPDYAAWQRRSLVGPAIDRELDYWRQRLAGVPVRTALPTSARPAVASSRGASVTLTVDPAAVVRLRTLSRRRGATLFMACIAGLRALLSRYTGQRDLCIGTPIASRRRRELAGSIGLFVNTLALRAPVTAGASFAELLDSERESALDAYGHAELPFERVVEALGIERDLGVTPVFQVLFVHQPAATPPPALGDAAVHIVTLDADAAQFDLTVVTTERDDRVEVSFLYNTDLFAAGMVEQMARHYVAMIATAAATPDAIVDDMALLASSDRDALLAWAGRGQPERPPLVADRIAEVAAERPDDVAIACAGDELSWRELDRRSARVASELTSRGVGPERRVALLLPRSIDWVVAMLGVLRAGGAFVPIDPDAPAERIADIVADCRACLVLTGGNGALAPIGGVPALALTEAAASTTRTAHAPVDRHNLAYIIYTSGSTGRPKGVEVQHDTLAELIGTTRRAFELRPGDRVSQVLAPWFDASMVEVWPCLAAGACLDIAPDDIAAVPDALWQWLAARRITVATLAAPVADALMDADLPPGLSLRVVQIGGDRLRRRPRGWNARIYNVYGPTENTVWSTAHELDDAEGAPPIGRPIDHVRAYVVDGRLELVPAGVPGELCLGGAGVARGYGARPALTAERFVPDPFSGEPGARLYRTGDQVRWRADGSLEFIGRIDYQVKIRGFRIELGEIEAVLADHPQVADVVVVDRERTAGTGDRQLVGYVVARGDTPPLASLRDHLARRLPDYMVPAAFVVVGALPRTATGKVDRRALPAPAADAYDRAEYVAPRTRPEQILADIWCALLRLDRVSIHDNFFALGGDSILSIQVQSRARRAGLSLSVRSVFERQTIAELAAAITEHRADAGSTDTELPGDAPLTPMQQMFFDLAPADPDRFPMVQSLAVGESLDPARLRTALESVAGHHDALRLRFRDRAGTWIQELSGSSTDSVQLVASTGTDLDDAAANAAAEQACRDGHDALDIARGPLLWAGYLDRGALPGRLILVAHHLAVDGVSWRILIEDLAAAYRGESLADRTTSFTRWARKLSEIPTDAGPLAREHWVAEAARDRDPVPVDHRDGELVRGTIRTLALRLDQAETRRLLQDVPAAYATRINDVLLAALSEAFWRWAQIQRLAITLEGHGREPVFDDVDLSRTVGWFTTTFPVALEHSGTDPGRRLQSIKEQLRRIPAHRIGPGVLRQRGLAPDRGMPPAVLFNYLGQLEHDTDGLFAPAPVPLAAEWDPAMRVEELLAINAAVVHGRLRCVWSYSAARHRESSVQALADHFALALRELIDHCADGPTAGYTPSDFPLAALDARQLDAVVAGRRDIEDIYPLTPLQEGLLFHSLAEPGSGVYIVQSGMTIDGDLDRDALRASFDELVARHSSLRTSIAWNRSPQPLQIVSRRAAVPWRDEDWRDRSAAEQAALRDAFVAADRRQGFDLDRAPLLRVAVIRTGDTRHELLWTQHHIISDGWSGAISRAELVRLYGARRGGPPARLGRAVPYRKHVAWMLERDPAVAEAYWRSRLAGLDEPTPLPFGAVPSGAPGIESTRVTIPGLGGRVSAAARRLHTTPSTLIHVAWGQVLARFAGHSDVVFGTVVSGRSAPIDGIDRIVGALLNTLPVRIRTDGREPVRAVVARVHAELAEQREHEHVSLGHIQRWSPLPSGGAMFSTLIAFENYPDDPELESRSRALGIRPSRTREQTSYPLYLAVRLGDDLTVTADRDRRWLSETQTSQLIDAYTGAVDQLCGDADQPAAELTRVSPELRRRMVDGWNDTARAIGGIAVIHRAIEATVDRNPAGLAVDRVTYRELDQRANQLAHELVARGARPDEPIAVLLPRTADLVVALLAVWKAGAAYLPLDPRHPPDRLAAIVRDAGAALAVSASPLSAAVSEVPAVLLDRDRAAIAARPTDRLTLTTSPSHLAYVIYTSGSTGKPKGVQIDHGAVANFLTSMARAPGLSSTDTVLAVTTISFDIAALELWLPLWVGGRVAIATMEDAADPARLAALIGRSGATVVQATPATWYMLTEAGWPGHPTLRALCGGEALPAALAAKLRPRVGELWNLYGPTETTIWSAARRIDADESPVLVGGPIDNTSLHVVDADLELVPPGVAGELCIGGLGLSRGYRGQPRLTADRFVPDPFGATGSRLYRTGDLVRARDDGSLEFIGRIDHQVKVRGYRIELGEIESALLDHGAVARCVVVARDVGDTRQLVAYVVPSSPGREIDPAALRAHLATRLPDYMLPAAYVALPQLPLNPSGKVDRKALPAPDDQARARVDHVAPRTARERALAAIWSDILAVDQVGVHDSFFALGGDSLLAIRLIARAGPVGIALAVTDIFEAPTIERLLELADRRDAAGDAWADRAADAGAVHRTIARTPRTGPIPVSHQQRVTWSGPEPYPRHQCSLRRIVQPVDVAAIQRAVDDIVRRHDSLRTRFESSGADLVQIVEPAMAVDVALTDVSALPADARLGHALALAERDAHAPLDPATGPLIRVSLFRLADDDQLMLIAIHRLMADGSAMHQFVTELGTLYAAFAQGRTVELPEPPVQYGDFCRWQAALFDSDEMARQLAYWRAIDPRRFSFEMSTDRPRRPGAAIESQPMASRSLTPESVDALRSAGIERGASLFVVLLAALKLQLCARTGNRHAVVGVPTIYRRPETEAVIGRFAKGLPMTTDMTGDPTFAAAIDRVRTTALEAQANQDVPVQLYLPDVSNMLGFNMMPPGGSIPGFAEAPIAPPWRALAPWLLNYTLSLRADRGLTINLASDPSLFEAETIRSLLDDYISLLELAPRRPDVRLGELRPR